MIRYIATAIIWSMTFTAAFAHRGPVIEVPKLASKPKIDGDLSDWQAHAWTNGVWDFERMKKQPEFAELVTWARIQDSGEEPPGTALTAADITGEYFMAWDDEGLYLGVRATDNVHDVSGGSPNPAAWWLKDSCSWYFDVPHDGDGLFVESGDHVFSFVADDTYPAGGAWWRLGELPVPTVTEVIANGSRGWRLSRSWLEIPLSAQYRVKIDPGTANYVIEAFVPFDLTWLTTPAIGDTIGGPMIVHTDPDGGPEEFGGQLQLLGAGDDDGTWADMVFVGKK